ncbi:uncharacterized protein LOC115061003 isoform X2 [Echeneis naucrates]|uniref:uncharacterized protein LOC115061003 isoform X2 n=1 Tax=Echeneis naucrates TaxID=173247 RepID=UPI00111466BE|nr:uncharacterized protein LOC115061003 isoform X2 [Echeneis naucrates]
MEEILRFFWPLRPIEGQVLLFITPSVEGFRQLNVFLLPLTVHHERVGTQQGRSVYIRTSSKCQLIEGEIYTVCCPEAESILPKRARLPWSSEGNYSPIFELQLREDLVEASITVQDHTKADVWKRRIELPGPGPSQPQVKPKTPPAGPQRTEKNLIYILTNLKDDEFQDFNLILFKKMLDDAPAKAKQLLEANREETVEVMVFIYGLRGAEKVMEQLLNDIKRSDLVKKLINIDSQAEGYSPAPMKGMRVIMGSKSFNPEVKLESTKVSYRFRCPGPGVFQCSWTGLVFVVDQEVELLYRTVQWDESLLQSAGKMAAGPLFEIQCPQNAVHQLHLPHCQIKEALPTEDRLLSVVHISDDGMSLLEPLEITNTHVIVTVPHLSALGLVLAAGEMLQSIWNFFRAIRGQLLLFLRSLDGDNRILDVFLLPSNIPVSEVAAQQVDAVYIKISSDCKLIIGKNYSLHCDTITFHIQPKLQR